MKKDAWAKRRVTARKYMGDDQGSWAVFIDGRTYVTGLVRSEVAYFRREAEKRCVAEEAATRG